MIYDVYNESSVLNLKHNDHQSDWVCKKEKFIVKTRKSFVSL